ncbi:MAG: transcriptional repressor [Labilithrix sp.]|nr:transcriptional repressor [Labilithrix sp.]MCW5835217.1 transcriptional repressor [Labilithrix sp.]
MQLTSRGRSGSKATKSKRGASGNPGVKDFQALLRTAGLRSTTPRIAVLEHFHAHGGQNSHAEIFEALGDRGFDRATIYRILMDLAEVGILSRTDLGDHVWRFELKKGVGGVEHTEEHPHFVCVDCGEVSCLPGLSIRLEGAAKAPKSVAKKKVSVQLKGRCDNCA